jgi:hypothetical protein
VDARCDDALLARSVGELRSASGLDRQTPAPDSRDRFLFARWATSAVAIVWGTLVPMAAITWWVLR